MFWNSTFLVHCFNLVADYAKYEIIIDAPVRQSVGLVIDAMSGLSSQTQPRDTIIPLT